MSFLPGWHPAGAAGQAPPIPTELAFIAATNGGSASSTRTFTSQSLGAADTHRWIIVGVVNFNNAGFRTTTAVTVAGVSATKCAELNSGVVGSSIWAAYVPTGTLGSIVVTQNASAEELSIATWRLLTSTPASSPFDDTIHNGSTWGSLDIPEGGALVAIALSVNAIFHSWTGATERFDFDIRSSEYFSGADASGLTAENNRQVGSNNSNYSGCAASFT